MKSIGLIFTFIWCVNAGAFSGAQTSQAYAYHYCGVIFSLTPSTANGPIHIAKTDGNGTVLFDFELIADSQNATNELAKVIWPNDQYIGCVGADEPPKQGYEGLVLKVKIVELMGQTTGFSIGK